MPAPHIRKILIALEMANAAGRQQLVGIIRFLGGAQHWDIRLVQPPVELTQEAVELAERERFDGLISALPCSEVVARRLAKAGLPIVLLDITYPHLSPHRVRIIRIDDVGIARCAARHFLQFGAFNDFAYLPHPSGETWSRQRETAFRRELIRAGRRLHLFRPCTTEEADRADRLAEWLASLAKPTALFCANDTVATQALDACHRCGLSVPEQVSILGVDDDEYLCSFASPPLSSVRPDFEAEGFQAARALTGLMDGRKVPTVTRRIPVSGITERVSTSRLSPGGVLVKRAMDFIRLNAARGITVTDVVTHLGVSRRLADLRFHEIENRSILQAITACRLKTVRQLLRETSIPIERLSRQCGFSSVNYLKELFRKHCGESMRDYRRRSAAKS